MSALAGIVRFDDTPVAAKDVDRLLTGRFAQQSDTPRVWSEPCAALGVRHVVATPEDIHDPQPLIDAQRGVVLVADARLDNREELGGRLKLERARLDRMSDGRLIIESYRRWGEDCVAQFEGGFVFALWSQRDKTLLLARDPMGERVLYWHCAHGRVIFCSGLTALVRYPGLEARLDEARLGEYLVLLHADPEATLYEGVRHVPSAHVLKCDAERTETRRYWTMDLERRIRLNGDKEYVASFQDVFGHAVRCRLRSATPIGALLSGGLDSSAVVAIAAPLLRQTGQSLRSFTAVPRSGFDAEPRRGQVYDESPYVEAIRRFHSNLDVRYVAAADRHFLSGIDDSFRRTGVPMMNVHNRPWFEAILRAAAAEDCRVLLTGQMGNSSISYNGAECFLELLYAGQWMRLWRELKARARRRGSSVAVELKNRVLAPLLPEPMWAAFRRATGRTDRPWLEYSAINPRFAEEIDVGARFRAWGIDPHQRRPTDGRTRRWYEMTRISGNEGHSIQGAWRHTFGVELRDPTFDRRLVEFCLAIPTQLYLRDGEDRWLLRHAMAGALPDAVRLRTGIGVQAADWHERFTAAQAEINQTLRTLRSSELAARCIDLPRLERSMERWPVADYSSRRVLLEYRYALSRALVLGRFIAWFESGMGSR